MDSYLRQINAHTHSSAIVCTRVMCPSKHTRKCACNVYGVSRMCSVVCKTRSVIWFRFFETESRAEYVIRVFSSVCVFFFWLMCDFVVCLCEVLARSGHGVVGGLLLSFVILVKFRTKSFWECKY